MRNVMHILQTKGYNLQYRVNTITNELEDLFFIHPTSLKMWQTFPYAVLMDATYKTNKYNLLFLEIVGVTSTNKTFSIAFAFIHNEKTSNYISALTCLKLTINDSFSPRVIVTDRDLTLMKACEDVFSQNVFDYLYTVWLGKYAERFSREPTCQTEKHLEYAKCDLDKFIHVIEKVVQSQETAIKETFTRCIITYMPRFKDRIFEILRKRVSVHAMDKILEEFHRSKRFALTPENCGCQLRTCFGLPCAHELVMYVGSPIPLDSNDAFWRKLDLTSSISVEYDDLNVDNHMQSLDIYMRNI
ncbi:uncharacterized protein LOC111911947 [Lactuca sativa]|uniref:uncharacterized protein LOC111911947 n=1 Tax=Lactuca sativa TaxID=4236 RepID=UPI000CD8E172|nr:uncharacterized protein LOC111911947 [Lactuca sativa]